MQSVLAECSATFEPGQITASVRFIGNDQTLTGLQIIVPAELGGLDELKVALRKLRIRARQVQHTTVDRCTQYLLDVAELDGSDVSRDRWVALQGVVLSCVIEACMSVIGEPQPRSSWRAFRDMLQKAPPRVATPQRRHA